MSERWFIAVPATVSEVDAATHQIKVVIHLIDEDVVHDEWVSPMLGWVGPPGYGPSHLPEVDTEVLLFGRYGQKHTLFYVSTYNETYTPPAEFADGQRGLKTDGDYRIISDGDLYLRGGRVIIEADASIQITAPGGFFVNGKRIG